MWPAQALLVRGYHPKRVETCRNVRGTEVCRNVPPGNTSAHFWHTSFARSPGRVPLSLARHGPRKPLRGGRPQGSNQGPPRPRTRITDLFTSSTLPTDLRCQGEYLVGRVSVTFPLAHFVRPVCPKRADVYRTSATSAHFCATAVSAHFGHTSKHFGWYPRILPRGC